MMIAFIKNIALLIFFTSCSVLHFETVKCLNEKCPKDIVLNNSIFTIGKSRISIYGSQHFENVILENCYSSFDVLFFLIIPIPAITKSNNNVTIFFKNQDIDYIQIIMNNKIIPFSSIKNKDSFLPIQNLEQYKKFDTNLLCSHLGNNTKIKAFNKNNEVIEEFLIKRKIYTYFEFIVKAR